MDLRRKDRRHALLLPAFAVAALGLMTGATGCSSGQAEAKKDDAPPAVPVEVATPKRGDMVAVYSGTAPIEAEQEAVVVAKVGGEVRQLLVEEGARVRAGQVLARLDGDRLRLEAAQARANLAKLERDYKRNVELQQRGLVAASAFENLRYELDGARASYELAALQLSYTEIRAPIGGVVAERFLKVGNTVSPNERAFRVADLTPLMTYVHVPEREMHKLKVRQVASAQVDAAGGVFDSVIARISPVVDSNTGTFKVTLELQDAKAQLKPGMFARVNIVYDRRKDVLQVPRSALVEDDGRTRLFLVEKGKAVARDVTLGLTNGGIVEVTAGLKDGDQVVVVGQGGLKSGNPVRVVGNTPGASGKPATAR